MKFLKLTGKQDDTKFINMERVVVISKINNHATFLQLDYIETRTDRTVEIFVKETPEMIVAMLGKNCK